MYREGRKAPRVVRGDPAAVIAAAQQLIDWIDEGGSINSMPEHLLMLAGCLTPEP